MALIGRADVALSVVMTTCSTLAAVVLTPRLTELLASQYVPVDGWALFLKVVQVVLLPLSIGVFLKQGLPRVARRVEPVMPPLAVTAIVLIVSSIVGSQRAALQQQGPLLLLACLLLHAGGFCWAFGCPAGSATPVRCNERSALRWGCRTQAWPWFWPAVEVL